jgi:drug/metabolite transporter (DMT)-like permease
MRLKLSHLQAVFLMVAVAFLWSTAGVATRHLEFASRFEVTFWRAIFCAFSLGLALLWSQGLALFRRMEGARSTFWYSALCWSVMFTAYMVALTMTRVGNVLVTMAIGPLLTALFAWMGLGHRVKPRTWMAIIVAGAGIAYMYAAQVGHVSLAATLVALCVPVAGALNWTVMHHAHEEGHGVDLVAAVLAGSLMTSLLTLPLAWPLRSSLHDVAVLGGLGIFQLALPCALCVQCARVLKAPEMSLLQLLEVIFGILLAWLGANEVPTSAVLTGGTLVIGALLANEWMGWRYAQ